MIELFQWVLEEIGDIKATGGSLSISDLLHEFAEEPWSVDYPFTWAFDVEDAFQASRLKLLWGA